MLCVYLFLSSSVPDLEENWVLTYFYSFSRESRPGMEEVKEQGQEMEGERRRRNCKRKRWHKEEEGREIEGEK